MIYGVRRWITRDTADGDKVKDANKGGRGKMFTLLRAFPDYVDANGSRRATFIPGALERFRGFSADSSRFFRGSKECLRMAGRYSEVSRSKPT